MRGFWSVSDPDVPGVANAFDVILRGQEVVSGSQHIHLNQKLREAMVAHKPPLDPDADM